jgi:hypothetical protein
MVSVWRVREVECVLLRLLRGSIEPGREDRFVATVRTGVLRKLAPATGLLSLVVGRRVEGDRERFLIGSSWLGLRDLHDAIGEDVGEAGATHAWQFDGIAAVERIDHLDLLEPVDPGVLDAPSAVIRLIEARLRLGREEAFYAFMRERHAQLLRTRLLLGFQIGRQAEDGRERVAAISSWAESSALERIVEAGRRSTAMFAALDEYLEDVRIEEFEAVQPHLPLELHHRGARRVLVAEFVTPASAAAARDMLEQSFPESRQAGIVVAPLGSTDYALPAGRLLLVCRLALTNAAPAERQIAGLGGRLLHAAADIG